MSEASESRSPRGLTGVSEPVWGLIACLGPLRALGGLKQALRGFRLALGGLSQALGGLKQALGGLKQALRELRWAMKDLREEGGLLAANLATPEIIWHNSSSQLDPL